jgi:hypothetical protein
MWEEMFRELVRSTTTIEDRHSLKTPNLKSEKPFGFRNGITISD